MPPALTDAICVGAKRLLAGYAIGLLGLRDKDHSSHYGPYRDSGQIAELNGIVLGLRYKVLILVPAVFVATIFAMTVPIARGDHFWSITLAMAIPGIAVEQGRNGLAHLGCHSIPTRM